jgi:cobalamin biosynthesis protein CobD/CbiB
MEEGKKEGSKQQAAAAARVPRPPSAWLLSALACALQLLVGGIRSRHAPL